MRAEIKFLVIGLFIGLGATVLLLTGMLVPPTLAASLATDTRKLSFTPSAHTSTQQSTATIRPPTNTYTFTPTFIQPSGTPTATSTPTLTPTVPSPTPSLSGAMLSLLESGYLSQRGSLSLEQQVDVYASSIKFIRSTTEEGYQLGNFINGSGYGSPSDICGPLSIAILQDAGIVRTSLNPHAFWLLNPDVSADRRLLNVAFPPILFKNVQYKHKLDTVDWNEFPLYPGDFIYIYAGSGGNFEHMLVVNRVDAKGRAYSVTNYNTAKGFIIGEILLYDPADPTAGIFPIWTARSFEELGSTGFGGFEIWRYYLP